MSNGASKILKKAFLRKKKGNPRFSMQMIATKMDISLPFTSQILSGKRNVPPVLVDGLAKFLGLDHEERDALARQVLKSKKLKAGRGVVRNLRDTQREPRMSVQRQANHSQWTPQGEDTFWILRKWHYLAILDSTLLVDYDGTSEYLAKRLRIPLAEANGYVQQLVAADFLEMTAKGWQKRDRRSDFHSQAAKEDIRAYHFASLTKAGEALTQNTTAADVEARFMTTSTVTLPVDMIPWAKGQIAEFLRVLCEQLSEERAEEVYQLSIQLFPLTHDRNKPVP